MTQLSTKFEQDIAAFNLMYKLPSSAVPTLQVGVPLARRLRDLKKILADELTEIDGIVDAVEDGAPDPDVLTMIADLLGDIQVYCASEMRKFGIAQAATLEIIMQSNFSKLGADGQPIYDDTGKVLKGPNYWRPEPRLKAMLFPSRDVDGFASAASEA